MTNYSLILARNFSVKLQNCYGNRPIAQCHDGVEVKDVTAEDVLCRATAFLEIYIEDTIGNLLILTFLKLTELLRNQLRGKKKRLFVVV